MRPPRDITTKAASRLAELESSDRILTITRRAARARPRLSPAPLVHAASKRARREIRIVYYLFVAAFRTAAADCPEWREAHDNLHAFMMDVLADCGLLGEPAEEALNVLRSLVRGYVLNEMMHTLIGVHSYEDSFESAVRVFIAGLSALIAA